MKSFDELHVKLKDRLQRQVIFMRECIQSIQMLGPIGTSPLHFATWLPLIRTDTRRVRVGMPTGTSRQNVHITLGFAIWRISA